MKSPKEMGDETTKSVLGRKCVTIVVLGDVGRSPRMRYHAESLAKEGFLVHMIGYHGGSKLPESVEKDPSIWVQFMPEAPSVLQGIPRLLAYPLKVAWQVFFLAWAFVWMLLRYQFYPQFILLQNPPAIPTLPVCYMFSKVLFADFVVDWHNYGYTIMGITLGEKHPLVQFSKKVEDFFGSRADKHFCVTRAMRDDLKIRLGIETVTLYDRPPEKFKPLSNEERAEFLSRFSQLYPSLKECNTKGSDRPGILVSSTSWTEDEDFRILLEALEKYEEVSTDERNLYPKLIVFITGKGPQKEYYRSLIELKKFEKVEIHLPWLEDSDYPTLLGSADLGVCLHYSSSGLDLPMKVVDMFGSGLPVCAINFNCISELVHHDKNGYVFKDSSELASHIQNWFKISSKPNPAHKTFRKNLENFQALRWHENWKLTALPVFS